MNTMVKYETAARLIELSGELRTRERVAIYDRDFRTLAEIAKQQEAISIVLQALDNL